MKSTTTIVSLALALAIAPGLPSCNDNYGLLLAKQVEQRAELVGGPVAMADIGDFLLQNDQIRVNILGPHDSQGPGVFGGSVVDVDVRRDRLGFGDGQGHDRFAEMFPLANLLVPDPRKTEVTVLKDGSDGVEAAIRVDGDGAFLFEALSILTRDEPLLKALFPDVKAAFHFRTDYILKPGDRHITIHTDLFLTDGFDGCDPAGTGCKETCPDGYAMDPTTGCFSCTCETPLVLDQYSGPVSVFGQLFGDDQNNDPTYRAGVIAGDFVFFGAQTDVFGPGIGYDTDKAVHDAFYSGQNTFQQPLSFDFVTASGGDVSYGYFTKPNPGETKVRVNVPLFTSAATAFVSAGKSCLFATSDDATCDNKVTFTFDRYLAVGQGDIASVADDVWKTRGTPVGHLSGSVQSARTGEPSTKAHVYVFTDPNPGHAWTSVDEIAAANQRNIGSYGLVNEIDADVGLPLVLDGSYHADLPAGSYVIVARSQDGMAFSTPQSLSMAANDNKVVIPELVTPGTVDYRVTGDTDALTPAKVALVSIDADGNPLEGDGLRRVYLGDSRMGNGVRAIDFSITGQGAMTIEPGRYRFRASRGPEYSIYEQDIDVAEGQVLRIDAPLTHEVDTSGWMSADMHLHSEPSFDSGMLLAKRVATIADEQVDFALPTDHDIETDYGPTIKSLFMDPYMATAVSAETTTIEQGHFIAFPLKYDHTIVPTHGSHDPTCQSGGQILDALRQIGADYPEGEPLSKVPIEQKPFTIVAHPRDGFFGYIYQLGVDPYTMRRQVSSLEANNPVFETASCDFDAMELINGKRFDLVRTATVSEVIDWNRCLAHIDAAIDQTSLVGVCPEITEGMIAPCDAGELFYTCQHRNRTAAAWAAMKRILTRTPDEQAAQWNYAQTSAAGQPDCTMSTYPGDAPVPADVAQQPCTWYSGHVDDFFRYVEHGMIRTHVASSDSHDDVHEPGYPRTYFQSTAGSPSGIVTGDMVASLRGGHAVTTYGPFITADVGGKTFGDVAKVQAGGKATLNLKVQTASWFGVDRIEVYENGLIVKVADTNPGPGEIKLKSKPEDIVDFDSSASPEDKIDLDIPAGRDSWVVIIAMGLQDQNLMQKVSRDIPFGEIQISKVTSDAFALIPVVNGFFTPVPTLPDWFPIPAYAVTNPIYLDADGNGKYDAPLPFPEFCSKPCDPSSSAVQCPDGQGCLDVGQCGVFVLNTCDHRVPWSGGGP